MVSARPGQGVQGVTVFFSPENLYCVGKRQTAIAIGILHQHTHGRNRHGTFIERKIIDPACLQRCMVSKKAAAIATGILHVGIRQTYAYTE